jgi:dipeptidyl-peptidase-4
MSIIKKTTWLALFFIFGKISAQEKLLTIEDCFNPKLYPQSLRAVQWIPESHKFSQTRGKAIVATDPFSKKDDTIITFDKLASLVAAEEGNLTSLPAITWKSGKEFWFVTGNRLFVYNTEEMTVISKRKFMANPETIEVANITLNAATVEGGNLFVTTAAGNRKLTSDAEDGIVYGQAVHRNEFGIDKGLFWSKDGTRLAFYRMEEKRVTKYPLVDVNPRPATSSEFRYPMAGDSSHSVTVGIYNTLTEEFLYLKTDGPYDQYLTNITWSPDNLFVYLFWVNREQNHMQLRRYRSSDGMLDKVLYEEKNTRYVEPENPVFFLPESNEKFIFFSEKDGFNHLYLFGEKKEPIQLTKGKWVVTDFLGFSKDGEWLYYEGTQESPLERHTYMLKIKEKEFKPKKITKGKGTHKIMLNHHASVYMDVFTSTRDPKKYMVFKYDGTPVNTVFESTNPIEDYKLGEMKIDPILIDGIPLYTRCYLPPDFNPKKKYPVVVYVYGGPHIQLITETWLGGGNLWMYYMAQNGYVVYTVDSRGSANRGFDFESITHRQLGTQEMKDQLAAVERLKRIGWVDSNRIGVHGWSFGGFMTTSLMTRSQGTFTVGVAGGPVIDWNYYEIMYTERYMDKPSENPEGYKKANLLNHVDNLRGRLLMIHGMDDDVVVMQHSLLYVKEAIKKMNVNLDYFVYPGHKHNVLGPDRAHLYKKISQYFFDYL